MLVSSLERTTGVQNIFEDVWKVMQSYPILSPAPKLLARSGDNLLGHDYNLSCQGDNLSALQSPEHRSR